MISNTIARSDDGTIQITFSIPKIEIDKAQEIALLELAKEVSVPGFRKGKAPAEKAKEKIDAGKLLEKSLGKILPDAYVKALEEHKIKPITYPKFEILKQGEVWEVRADVAELPVIDLGDYKTTVAGAIRSASLKKELTKEEKENVVIQTLLAGAKLKVPKIVVESEVNMRLSSLLSRIEKLGLDWDAYLGSIGKDEKTLREEYEKQITEGISLELILNKIADEEKIEVSEKEVEDTIHASGVTGPHEEQTMVVRQVLKRRSALEKLANLT